jgi:hypothetical protein
MITDGEIEARLREAEKHLRDLIGRQPDAYDLRMIRSDIADDLGVDPERVHQIHIAMVEPTDFWGE